MAGGFPCCCGCKWDFGEELTGANQCGACAAGRSPGVWKVVLSGILPQTGLSACSSSEADRLNATYFVCATQQNPSSCDWELALDPPICGFTIIRLVVVASFPAGIFVGLHRGAHHADWRKNYPIGPNPDCLANDLDIPYAPIFTTTGAKTFADFSQSTCVVSSGV